MAAALKKPNAVLVTGAINENHPEAALLRTLVALIAEHSGAKILRLTTGANSAGAWVGGMIPHRRVAGQTLDTPGLSVTEAIHKKLKAYVLLAVDALYDFANPKAVRDALLGSDFVVSFSAFVDESMADILDVILPIAPFSETSGTYINVDQSWQTVKGVVTPFGEARPAWKVLRVLGNLFKFPGFDFTSTQEVFSEVHMHYQMTSQPKTELYYSDALPELTSQLMRIGEWPLYRADAIVRHSEALQQCAAMDSACIRIHPKTASDLKLNDTATVSQGNIKITLPLFCDERIPVNAVWIPNAMPETVDLGPAFAAITIK